MNPAAQLWLLLPHAFSAACFGAAFGWQAQAGSNRTDPDLYLGIAGYATLAAAVITTIISLVLVFRGGIRRYWPWISIHLAAICIAFLIADA